MLGEEWYREMDRMMHNTDEKYHNERGNPHKEPTWFAEDHPSSIK
jgi:hypothetical protein